MRTTHGPQPSAGAAHGQAQSAPASPNGRSSRARARQVAILAYPGVQSLDITGPLEVFAGAQTLIEAVGGAERGYDTVVLSRDGAPLRTSSGLGIVPHGDFASTPMRLDTLIVAGGYGSRAACADPATVEWIARTSARARRTASVCTGAFL
ncbi:MAG: DJ-1/PfpI family protein, partial [Solirubrobacteraceae bacterium]